MAWVMISAEKRWPLSAANGAVVMLPLYAHALTQQLGPQFDNTGLTSADFQALFVIPYQHSPAISYHGFAPNCADPRMPHAA
jgi:hypothetical protein